MISEKITQLIVSDTLIESKFKQSPIEISQCSEFRQSIFHNLLSDFL